MRLFRLLLTGALLTLAIQGASAGYGDAPSALPGNRRYSLYPEQTFPNRVFFGDTHLHTSFSTDSGMIGNRLGPDQAYRFARGETVTSSTGLPARLARPLDFLVVADHAESLGAAPAIRRRDPLILETEFGRRLSELTLAGKPD